VAKVLGVAGAEVLGRGHRHGAEVAGSEQLPAVGQALFAQPGGEEVGQLTQLAVGGSLAQVLQKRPPGRTKLLVGQLPGHSCLPLRRLLTRIGGRGRSFEEQHHHPRFRRGRGQGGQPRGVVIGGGQYGG
jgi:hypothetical protein